MTDYFEAEAASCQDPDAKIQECFNNIARYDQQLQQGGADLFMHYLAWPLYWLGTALFVWEKKRGIDVAKFYKKLRDEVLRKEWLEHDKKTSHDSADALNQQAVEKLKAGDEEGAKAVLFDIIKRWPTRYEAYHNLACIFWESGDFQNAIKYFEDALKISQFNRLVVLSYGEMLVGLKKYAKAKDLYEAYLKTNPNDFEIRSLLQKTEGVLEKVNKLKQVVEKMV